MKVNDCQGDLTGISAETKSLVSSDGFRAGRWLIQVQRFVIVRVDVFKLHISWKLVPGVAIT